MEWLAIFQGEKYNIKADNTLEAGVLVDYKTIKEAAEMRDISVRAVTCRVMAGRIPGAVKKGIMRLIPAASKRPEDKCSKPCGTQNA